LGVVSARASVLLLLLQSVRGNGDRNADCELYASHVRRGRMKMRSSWLMCNVLLL
jgi:hypothetical protein